MGIQYFEKERIFKLDTKASTYMIGIVDDEKFIGHVYYGPYIKDHNAGYLMRTGEGPFVPSRNNRDRLAFYDSFPTEYPTHGLGDFRDDAIAVRTINGNTALKLSYESHEIYKGKKPIPGLPATFGSDSECSTLEINCIDEILSLNVILSYSVFEDTDAIARSVKVINNGKDKIKLTRVMSMCLDMDNEDYDLITLHGSWARERRMNRRPLTRGFQGTSSIRGESGHQEHPFMAILEHNADQDKGEVYGISFVYSGNFFAECYVNQFDSVRALMGINPEDFEWVLEPGEEFCTPEAVMVHSSEGLGGMTRSFHDLFRNHLIRSPYKDRKRPILINNWEATYFNFDTDKLISIAEEAASLGIEMLVMDDGWFGRRDSDNSSLGDWYVYEDKLKGGLKYLVDEVNKRGLKFGIWFEPEMISPDSDLYRAHPDWAIQIQGRTPGQAREQFVLDLTRPEVVDFTYDQVKTILQSANIEYVKWDMNRPLADMGSAKLPPEKMGEMFHRYMLGVYELQERLITDFPDLLLENCSGGGARFDPGMLYYSPQIWCSDDTDAVERLSIQEGTSLVYPLSTMGAHVSDCPNHALGRTTPFRTRGYVALAGTFGYELDVTRIPEEDRNMIPAQVDMYHKYNDIVRMGDYYRIASYYDNHEYDCYMVVSKDKTEALITYIQVLNRINYHSRKIRLKGLDPEKNYKILYVDEDDQTAVGNDPDRIWSGELLMNGGLLILNPWGWGDFKGRLISIREA